MDINDLGTFKELGAIKQLNSPREIFTIRWLILPAITIRCYTVVKAYEAIVGPTYNNVKRISSAIIIIYYYTRNLKHKIKIVKGFFIITV